MLYVVQVMLSVKQGVATQVMCMRRVRHYATANCTYFFTARYEDIIHPPGLYKIIRTALRNNCDRE